MSNKKFQIWLPLLLSVVMIVGMFMGYKMRDAMPGKSFFYNAKPNTIQEVVDLINSRYVDAIDNKTITDTAIQAILSKLDPHSVYIPAADVAQTNEEIKGSFYGVGIEYSFLNDTLNVTNVLKDGPSAKAGILIGDKIIKAGDSTVSGKKVKQENVRSIFRGAKDTDIKVAILRNGSLQNITITRGLVPIYSLDVAYMLDSTTGFIRLNKFSTQTYREFMTSILSLKQKGMKSLVLDLRGNGGGVLEEATEIADEFIEGDKLITYTEGLHAPKKEFRCRRQGQFEQGKLIVLADEGTASASEVLLGALQDWDRATIVGRRTFGKGLVQEQFNLNNNAALRLTIARYYTPIGRSIQRPYNNGSKQYYAAITNRMNDGEMVSADSVKNDTTKVYKSKAGKKLYGNGGITPDYFVAADTSKISATFASLYQKGTLSNFGYAYYQQQKANLAQYKTANDFVSRFNVNENAWQYFETLAKTDSIAISSISTTEKVFLEKSLKAAIARQLFRLDGYFQVQNKDDQFIIKALQIAHQ
ncbi:S41 family peptidase [Ferruginibacter yonginensis]|uniref:S41 family peptidase n=1 Tax=Ferruginibacter yonginensis TaxID=1310416 RepID=A0ABV8QMR7_9BACT